MSEVVFSNNGSKVCAPNPSELVGSDGDALKFCIVNPSKNFWKKLEPLYEVSDEELVGGVLIVSVIGFHFSFPWSQSPWPSCSSPDSPERLRVVFR